MKKEVAIAVLISWVTVNTHLVIQLMFVLIPVLALLLAVLTVYAVFWKRSDK